MGVKDSRKPLQTVVFSSVTQAQKLSLYVWKCLSYIAHVLCSCFLAVFSLHVYNSRYIPSYDFNIFSSIFNFSFLHTRKIDYDGALCDIKVAAWRAMRICDMLVPAEKSNAFVQIVNKEVIVWFHKYFPIILWFCFSVKIFTTSFYHLVASCLWDIHTLVYYCLVIISFFKNRCKLSSVTVLLTQCIPESK